MGYQLSMPQAEALFQLWKGEYDLFAPMRMEGEGCFADTDIIRYGSPASLEEIVWDKRSDYSFKEALLPINETLFYFTEDQTTIPKAPEKGILVFLRACDLNAVKRLDDMYLNNGTGDFYYARMRERAKFVLMGCPASCNAGFCVSMGTNRADNYDLYLKLDGSSAFLDVKDNSLLPSSVEAAPAEVSPDSVSENKETVALPKKLSTDCYQNPIWEEYGSRCVACGRCNFVCPTCTCYTMQDIFYQDNPRVGERRRVWASCQVDGFTDIAGGISFRKSQGERMRFKVLHKIADHQKRFGHPMCVGCGRCDDVCPEYISFSNCVNRLAKEEEEP